MCQRFSITEKLSDLTERFKLDGVNGAYQPRYNVAPTQMAPVIVEERGERKLHSMRWGLLPYWSIDAVNADGQRIGDRKIFRRMTNKQRCVIPISGFYGWKSQGRVHQPVHFVHRSGSALAVPGFYELWPRVEGGDILAYTMLTTTPNSAVDGYAERMPAVLDEWGIDDWLSERKVEYRGVYSHIRELSDTEIRPYAVGAYVNDRSLESPACVEPILPAFASLRR